MNSLEIYKINEICNIITLYKTQIEKIEKLEKELYSGDTEIEFNIGMKNFKLKIEDFKINLYLNNKLSDNFDFKTHFNNCPSYLKGGIYQYITNNICNRYRPLPFNEPYYFDCIDSIIYSFFGFKKSITKMVEQDIVSNYDIEEQHIYVKQDRKFYYKILDFLDNQEGRVVRDCYEEICNFFNDF